MALTAVEKQRRYQERLQREIDAMPKIACVCGCGTQIAPITKGRKPAKYAHGHNSGGQGTRFQPGHRETAATRKTRTRRGAEHWRWNGGEWYLSSGYVRVTLSAEEAAAHPTARRHHKKATQTSYSIPRSHLVWNAAHPKDLVQPGEHVHHRNGVRDDDRVENLEKMDAREHLARHGGEWATNRPRDKTGRFH